MAREVLFQRYGEHRDYEGESFDFQDELEPSFQQSSVDDPISQDNVGYQLMKKMGWQSGCGLGKQQQGRVDPVPMVNKQDSGGIGRLEMELEQVKEVGQHRKVLEVEKEDTEERRQKRKTHVEQEKALAESTAALRQSYFCMDCNKQYSNYTEYDNHVNSYDHAHRQRFRNLRAQDFSRRMGSKKRKRDKATEDEAKRMNLLIAKERAEAAHRKKTGNSSGFRPVVGSELTDTPTQKPSFKPVGGSALMMNAETDRAEKDDGQLLDHDGVPCIEDSHIAEHTRTFPAVQQRPPAPPAPPPPLAGRTAFTSTKPSR